MGRESIREEQVLHINGVMNYIQEHLAETLDVRTLARVGGYSEFHFQRLFKQITGDNVNDYINRQRLQRARKMLLFQPWLDLTTIAGECGFASSSSFSRKFKRMVGVTASLYREANALCERVYPPEQLEKLAAIPVAIRERAPMPVAYVRHMDGYIPDRQHRGIRKAFCLVSDHLLSLEGVDALPMKMGLSLDDPFITPIHRCRFDACIPCHPEFLPSGGVCRQVIPGGLYAIASLDAQRQTVWDLMHLLHVVWLPNSRFQLDYRPLLEIYLHSAHPAPSQPDSQSVDPRLPHRSVLQVCIPVKPKG